MITLRLSSWLPIVFYFMLHLVILSPSLFQDKLVEMVVNTVEYIDKIAYTLMKSIGESVSSLSLHLFEGQTHQTTNSIIFNALKMLLIAHILSQNVNNFRKFLGNKNQITLMTH